MFTNHFSLSCLFKAMLDGHFKEASEDKITLGGKDLTSMVLFLKVLYPPSMFEESRSPLNDESRLSVMALAEEYQCVNLIKQCIDKAKITPANVLEILPYASKYHPTALPRMFNVINWCAPASKLEEVLPTLESKETSIKMLLTKCRYLESSIVDMQDGLFSLLYDCLKELKEYTRIYQVPPVFSTKKDYRCLHAIKIREINKAKYCIHCEEKYKEEFLLLSLVVEKPSITLTCF